MKKEHHDALARAIVRLPVIAGPAHINDCEQCQQTFLTGNEYAVYCPDCRNDLKGHARDCI